MKTIQELEALRNQARKDKNINAVAVYGAVVDAFRAEEKKKNASLTEAEMVKIVSKMSASRQESASIYVQNNRPELAYVEQEEALILDALLPQPLTVLEVEQLVEDYIKTTQVELVKKNMGGIVSGVVAQSKGRTDGRTVSTIVNNLLSVQNPG